MFTTVEYQLIKQQCPNDLSQLLGLLKITDSSKGERDLKAFERIDEEIDAWLRNKMRVNSTFEVFSSLLQFANEPLLMSDTNKELIAKICNKTSAIKAGVLAVQPSTPQGAIVEAPGERHQAKPKEIMGSIGVALAILTSLYSIVKKEPEANLVVIGLVGASSFLLFEICKTIFSRCNSKVEVRRTDNCENTTQSSKTPKVSAKDVDDVLAALALIHSINKQI